MNPPPRGGKRPGSGRKPVLNPKVLVNFSLDPALVAHFRDTIPRYRRSLFVQRALTEALAKRPLLL